jgi:hypothetical protein
MSAKNSPAAMENHIFVPRPLELVQVDKLTVKLYPVVDSSMKPPKCAHTFQINKTALYVPGIDRCAMLDTLGAQLNLSTIVHSVFGDWNRHFPCNWCNFQHLTILSFHSSAGTQVNDTTDASDSAILLPIINGSLADCRKQVRFILVQLNLNFASLVPPSIQGLTILRVEFYIELPQSTRDMTNERSQPYCLTSWLGNADLRAMSAANLTHDVLSHTLQDGRIDLLHPKFNLTLAKTDSTPIKEEISSKIIRPTTPLVFNSLFNQLCPRYSKEPHAALDHVRQTYDDANGNTVMSSVHEYYTQILAASCPFIDQEVLPVSICQAFINGLDHRLMAGFRTHFPDYIKSQDRAATHKRKILQEMLQAAQWAEMEYKYIKAIALEASGFGGQAFTAQVNASQAERTISRYSNDNSSNWSGGSGSTLKGPLHCYGYGGPHPWSLLKNGIHVIKCPNASNPGIHKNAKKVIECIRNMQKKKQQEFTKRKNLATTNFSNFDAASQERIRNQVLSVSTDTTSVASSITRVTGGTSAAIPAKIATAKPTAKRVVFLYNAQALNTDIHRPVLPVSIHSIMPHIHLQLGTNLNDSSSPSIHCAWILPLRFALAITISLLPSRSGTLSALQEYSFWRTIHPSSYLASFRTMLMLSPLI